MAEMQNPFFSIVMPTYNRQDFLPKSIGSIQRQSYSNWELIIIDDASTDQTQEVLASYSTDIRIRIHRNSVNMERSASRNYGMKLAQGTYICFLDSDDCYLPHHLETLFKYITECNYEVAFFHTTAAINDGNGNRLRILKFDYSVGRNRVEQVLQNHIPIHTVALHHEITSRFQFDTSLSINEDVYFFAKIAALYEIIYIPAETVIWLIHGSNTKDKIKNHFTPQLIATNKIFNDPEIKPYISRSFARAKFNALYSGLVSFTVDKRQFFKAIWYLFLAFYHSPLSRKNKTNFVTIIYALPFGIILKRRIAKLKLK
jgi:glycosyltransferase involved in cell wall biosynthesis